jgi:hypothetical protein
MMCKLFYSALRPDEGMNLMKLDISKQLEDVTPPTLPLSKGRSEEGLFSPKQLFPVDTKISCPELFQDNRKCQVKADIIIKRREVTQETKVNRTFRNGGCQPSIEFWMSDVRGISFAVNYVHPAILKTLTIIKKEKEVKYQRSEYEGRFREVKEGKL